MNYPFDSENFGTGDLKVEITLFTTHRHFLPLVGLQGFELFCDQQDSLNRYLYESPQPEVLLAALGTAEQMWWITADDESTLEDYLVKIAQIADIVQADRLFLPRIVKLGLGAGHPDQPQQTQTDRVEEEVLDLDTVQYESLLLYARYQDGPEVHQRAYAYLIQDDDLSDKQLEVPTSNLTMFQGLLGTGDAR